MRHALRPLAAASLLVAFVTGLIVVDGIAVPPPALASACSAATGGDNDRLIKANNSNTGAGGWNCAYVYSTGNKSISAFGVQTVVDISANGYQKTYDCTYRSDNDVSISKVYVDGGGTIGSSMTYMVGNGEDGTRHWTGAILWMTKKYSDSPYPGQYLQNCDNYTIGYNAMWQTDLSWSDNVDSGSSFTTGTVIPVTLKVTGEGKTPLDMPVYVFQSTDPNSTADDTVIAQASLVGNVANVNVKLPTEGWVDVWGAYPGTNWQTAVPPSEGFLGSVTAKSSFYVYNPRPYDTVTTLTMPPVVTVGSAGTAQITVTTPANSYAAKPSGIDVTLYQQVGSAPDSARDLRIGTATLLNGAATMSVTPPAFGNYQYYVTFPGLLASGSSTPPAQYKPSQSATVPVTADYSCTTETGSTNPTKIKADNSSTDPRTGFNCAYVWSSGTRNVQPFMMDVLYHTADRGYAEIAYCIQKSSGYMSVSTLALGGSPPTRQWQAVNNDIFSKHQWGSSVLYMAQQNSAAPLAGQYGKDCSNYQLPANLLADPKVTLTLPPGVMTQAPATVQVSVTTNPAVTVSNVPVQIFQMKGTSPSSSDPSVGGGLVVNNASSVVIFPYGGNLNFYAVLQPSNYATTAPPSLGWAAGMSSIVGAAVPAATAASAAKDVTRESARAVAAGGPGDDEIIGRTTQEFLDGGPGNDVVRDTGGRALVVGGPGDDLLAGAGGSRLDARDGSGGDVVECVEGDVVYADGGDRLVGPCVRLTEFADASGAPRDLKSAAVAAAPRSRLLTPIVVNQRGRGDLSARCPANTVMQTFFAGSSGRPFDPGDVMVNGSEGVSLRNRAGTMADLQVSCRPARAEMAIEGRVGQGSARADSMSAVEAGSVFTGGPGDDMMSVLAARSALDGGLGADWLIIKAVGGQAAGGPGGDRLEADGGGAILDGGAGLDDFRAGKGLVFINARDGRGGDTVTCTSPQNKVMADRGDILRGPCTVIRGRR